MITKFVQLSVDIILIIILSKYFLGFIGGWILALKRELDGRAKGKNWSKDPNCWTSLVDLVVRPEPVRFQ